MIHLMMSFEKSFEETFFNVPFSIYSLMDRKSHGAYSDFIPL